MVENLFDQMATSWDCEHTTNRFDTLIDALRRGEVPTAGACVEIGSGTGQHTGFLTEVFDQVIAVDISAQMLANAPAGVGARVRADAAALPIATASLAAAVCVDVFCTRANSPASCALTGRCCGSTSWARTRCSWTPRR